MTGYLWFAGQPSWCNKASIVGAMNVITIFKVGNVSSKVSDQWVKLNIGGTQFLTTKLTLTRDPESFLCRLCDDDSGLTSSKDENGAYLVDRDPKYFRPVLNYLRHGKLIVDDGLSLEGILEEAEFYNLAELTAMVKNESARPQQYKATKCSRHSIAGCISKMEPGWKFEQVALVRGGEDEYGAYDKYLLVTSKNSTSSG